MKRIFLNMNLKTKLMVSFLIICIVPLLIVSMILYNYAAKAMEENSLEFASVFNSQIVSGLDDFMNEYDRATKSILIDYDIITNISNTGELTINEQVKQKEYIKKVMTRLLTLQPNINHIILLTPQDTLYELGRTGDTTVLERLKGEEWLLELLNRTEPLGITIAHNGSYYAGKRERFILTVGRKLYNSGGGYVGILLFDIDPSSLIQLNEDFLAARNNYNIKISITDESGGALYDSDAASGRISWEEALEQEELFYDKNPEDFIIMSTQTSKGGLFVHAVIPRSELLMKIDKIHYVRVIGILAGIVSVAIVSYVISSTLTNSIKLLQNSMKKAEEGEYQTICVPQTGDEIGHLVASYNTMIQKIKILIEEVYMADIKQKNAKILALQTQINPHMLYNTLEVIRMKALLRGEDEIAEMIKILSRMFRISLKKQKLPHTIRNEVEYVEYYMKIQNLRYKDRFFLEVDVQEEVLGLNIIALIFQPIIENSIEHGFQRHNVSLHIALRGWINENNHTVIQIQDDGKGMGTEQIEEINDFLFSPADVLQESSRSSIGLRNIAERLRLHYGEDSYLKIKNADEEGTLVEICIPVVRLKSVKEKKDVSDSDCG